MYIINCITYTYCKKLYIGETRRRQGDRFQEHLRDVERNDTDPSKPVARHSNLPNHSKHHIAVFGLSPTSRQFGKPKNSRINIYLPNRHPLILTVSTSAFHLTNLFLFSRHHVPTNNVAPFSAYKPTHNLQFLQLVCRRANARNVSL